ncbi:MAG TPA: DUF4129 domain-containing protein [Polyangiales bacterium]|jgi:hypothetical protein|nr:DUF4129 domain-containing protein [Polyangiales bacterium]
MQGASSSSLRVQGPVEIVDRTLTLVRRVPLALLSRAWLGSLPLAAAVLATYELERVEGVHNARLGLAFLLVLGFVFRAVVLGRVARAFALELRPSLPVSDAPGGVLDVACTAAVVGSGLWLWLWPLGGAAMVSPFAVALVFPLLSARGAVGPSWLARSACAEERGVRAFGLALDDTAGVRGVMATVELLVLLGALCLLANLYAITGLLLGFARSLLGVETSFVSAFLSPDNEVVPLVMATITLVLVEPLRAAVSAYAFVDARSRRDGADLHAAVDAVIAAASARAKPSRGITSIAVGLLLALSCTALASAAHADGHAPKAAQARAELAAQEARDAQVRDKVQRILKGKEFSEVVHTDTHGFWKWLMDWLEDLFKQEPEKPKDSSGFHIDLPAIAPWTVMLAALLVVALVVYQVMAESRRRPRKTGLVAPAAATLTPSEQEPRQLLDTAAQLAERGLYREALRALYVATLAALDRARLIRFEPDKTNGQYLRGMPPSEMRQLFGAFTRIFDHKWYGREEASVVDYEQCRQLADRICAWQELP